MLHRYACCDPSYRSSAERWRVAWAGAGPEWSDRAGRFPDADDGQECLHDEVGSGWVYSFREVPSGLYSLTVDVEGFARLTRANVSIAAGQTRQLDVTVAIAVQQQDVDVTARNNGVSVNPDENGGAIVLNGGDLDALSDDPDQLQNELQALAGPAAGPNGGEIYVDGFSGGQLPPKSSIREIRINQNPFSAEFDKIGYGRIEILTKPGSDKFSGHVGSFGSTSALNTGNPLVQVQPDYYLDSAQGDVNGPLTKAAFLFFQHVLHAAAESKHYQCVESE
jgi:hypothetical protein